MTLTELRGVGLRTADRVKALPLPVVGATLAVLVALAIFFALSLSGPSYSALFQGLSPARGGQVIAALQKLGIPYRLAENGQVIEVPTPDVGRARLELGKDGVPVTAGGDALQSLEKVSMTASSASVSALQLAAKEQSLEAAIRSLSGAPAVKVLLAIPHYTPFLADQAKPKASVILTGAPRPDGALGAAIARLVAGAVPGLSEHDVVVETAGGSVLFPASANQTADEQLAIQNSIEATQSAKIRSLLTPLFGAGNFRIAVAADVAFSHDTVTSVSYGPKSVPVSVDARKSSRVGPSYAPIGIPGALSNQPPGNTTAPLPQSSASSSNTPTGNASAGKTSAKTGSTPGKEIPQSTSSHTKSNYDVDTTETEEHPAGWQIKAIDVSLVVNQASLGAMTQRTLQTMIAGAIAVPKSAVVVTAARFIAPGAPVRAAPLPIMGLVFRALLTVLAAVALLLGVFRPMLRFVSGIPVRRPEPVVNDRISAAEEDAILLEAESTLQGQLRQAIARVSDVGNRNPAAIAQTLQRWAVEGPPGRASGG